MKFKAMVVFKMNGTIQQMPIVTSQIVEFDTIAEAEKGLAAAVASAWGECLIITRFYTVPAKKVKS